MYRFCIDVVMDDGIIFDVFRIPFSVRARNLAKPSKTILLKVNLNEITIQTNSIFMISMIIFFTSVSLEF